jgi:hypothetical protein
VLAALPFLGILVGVCFANSVEPYVLGLPAWLADLNLGVVALGVNVLVTAAVSTATRGSAPVDDRPVAADEPRFARAGEPARQRMRQR